MNTEKRKTVFEEIELAREMLEQRLRDEFMDMMDEAEQEAEAGEILFDEIDEETGQGYVYPENVDEHIDMAIHLLWEAGENIRQHLDEEYGA